MRINCRLDTSINIACGQPLLVAVVSALVGDAGDAQEPGVAGPLQELNRSGWKDLGESVRPLAEALRDGGVDVWYDEFELKIGHSLRRKIDSGIARSRFGIVVLSPSFFAKGWPQYELDGLVTMAVSGAQVLLPLWHGISKDEVVRQSPSLADKVALRTADYTIAEIAAEITSVVHPEHPR